MIFTPIIGYEGNGLLMTTTDNLYMGVSTIADQDVVKTWFSNDDDDQKYQIKFNLGGILGRYSKAAYAGANS